MSPSPGSPVRFAVPRVRRRVTWYSALMTVLAVLVLLASSALGDHDVSRGSKTFNEAEEQTNTSTVIVLDTASEHSSTRLIAFPSTRDDDAPPSETAAHSERVSSPLRTSQALARRRPQKQRAASALRADDAVIPPSPTNNDDKRRGGSRSGSSTKRSATTGRAESEDTKQQQQQQQPALSSRGLGGDNVLYLTRTDLALILLLTVLVTLCVVGLVCGVVVVCVLLWRTRRASAAPPPPPAQSSSSFSTTDVRSGSGLASAMECLASGHLLTYHTSHTRRENGVEVEETTELRVQRAAEDAVEDTGDDAPRKGLLAPSGNRVTARRVANYGATDTRDLQQSLRVAHRPHGHNSPLDKDDGSERLDADDHQADSTASPLTRMCRAAEKEEQLFELLPPPAVRLRESHSSRPATGQGSSSGEGPQRYPASSSSVPITPAPGGNQNETRETATVFAAAATAGVAAAAAITMKQQQEGKQITSHAAALQRSAHGHSNASSSHNKSTHYHHHCQQHHSHPVDGEEDAKEGQLVSSFRPENDKDRAAYHSTYDSRYRLVRRIGDGAFSSVYLVQRKSDGRHFALKYIVCADDRERLAAIRECETIHSVQGHESVITLVDMFMSYEFQPVVPQHHPKSRSAAASRVTTPALRPSHPYPMPTAAAAGGGSGGAGMTGGAPAVFAASSTSAWMLKPQPRAANTDQPTASPVAALSASYGGGGGAAASAAHVPCQWARLDLEQHPVTNALPMQAWSIAEAAASAKGASSAAGAMGGGGLTNPYTLNGSSGVNAGSATRNTGQGGQAPVALDMPTVQMNKEEATRVLQQIVATATAAKPTVVTPVAGPSASSGACSDASAKPVKGATLHANVLAGSDTQRGPRLVRDASPTSGPLPPPAAAAAAVVPTLILSETDTERLMNEARKRKWLMRETASAARWTAPIPPQQQPPRTHSTTRVTVTSGAQHVQQQLPALFTRSPHSSPHSPSLPKSPGMALLRPAPASLQPPPQGPSLAPVTASSVHEKVMTSAGPSSMTATAPSQLTTAKVLGGERGGGRGAAAQGTSVAGASVTAANATRSSSASASPGLTHSTTALRDESTSVHTEKEVTEGAHTAKTESEPSGEEESTSSDSALLRHQLRPTASKETADRSPYTKASQKSSSATPSPSRTVQLVTNDVAGDGDNGAPSLVISDHQQPSPPPPPAQAISQSVHTRATSRGGSANEAAVAPATTNTASSSAAAAAAPLRAVGTPHPHASSTSTTSSSSTPGTSEEPLQPIARLPTPSPMLLGPTTAAAAASAASFGAAVVALSSSVDASAASAHQKGAVNASAAAAVKAITPVASMLNSYAPRRASPPPPPPPPSTSPSAVNEDRLIKQSERGAEDDAVKNAKPVERHRGEVDEQGENEGVDDDDDVALGVRSVATALNTVRNGDGKPPLSSVPTSATEPSMRRYNGNAMYYSGTVMAATASASATSAGGGNGEGRGVSTSVNGGGTAVVVGGSYGPARWTASAAAVVGGEGRSSSYAPRSYAPGGGGGLMSDGRGGGSTSASSAAATTSFAGAGGNLPPSHSRGPVPCDGWPPSTSTKCEEKLTASVGAGSVNVGAPPTGAALIHKEEDPFLEIEGRSESSGAGDNNNNNDSSRSRDADNSSSSGASGSDESNDVVQQQPVHDAGVDELNPAGSAGCHPQPSVTGVSGAYYRNFPSTSAQPMIIARSEAQPAVQNVETGGGGGGGGNGQGEGRTVTYNSNMAAYGPAAPAAGYGGGVRTAQLPPLVRLRKDAATGAFVNPYLVSSPLAAGSALLTGSASFPTDSKGPAGASTEAPQTILQTTTGAAGEAVLANTPAHPPPSASSSSYVVSSTTTTMMRNGTPRPYCRYTNYNGSVPNNATMRGGGEGEVCGAERGVLGENHTSVAQTAYASQQQQQLLPPRASYAPGGGMRYRDLVYHPTSVNVATPAGVVTAASAPQQGTPMSVGPSSYAPSTMAMAMQYTEGMVHYSNFTQPSGVTTEWSSVNANPTSSVPPPAAAAAAGVSPTAMHDGIQHRAHGSATEEEDEKGNDDRVGSGVLTTPGMAASSAIPPQPRTVAEAIRAARRGLVGERMHTNDGKPHITAALCAAAAANAVVGGGGGGGAGAGRSASASSRHSGGGTDKDSVGSDARRWINSQSSSFHHQQQQAIAAPSPALKATAAVSTYAPRRGTGVMTAAAGASPAPPPLHAPTGPTATALCSHVTPNDEADEAAAAMGGTPHDGDDQDSEDTPRHTGFVCLVMEYHPMGDLCHYVLRNQKALAQLEEQQQQRRQLQRVGTASSRTTALSRSTTSNPNYAPQAATASPPLREEEGPVQAVENTVNAAGHLEGHVVDVNTAGLSVRQQQERALQPLTIRTYGRVGACSPGSSTSSPISVHGALGVNPYTQPQLRRGITAALPVDPVGSGFSDAMQRSPQTAYNGPAMGPPVSGTVATVIGGGQPVYRRPIGAVRDKPFVTGANCFAAPSAGAPPSPQPSLASSLTTPGWALATPGERSESLNPLSEPQLLSIAYQVASVLHHLHSRDPPVIHRDLKPENILIKGEPRDLLPLAPASQANSALSASSSANLCVAAAAGGGASGRVGHGKGEANATPASALDLAAPSANANTFAASARAASPTQRPHSMYPPPPTVGGHDNTSAEQTATTTTTTAAAAAGRRQDLHGPMPRSKSVPAGRGGHARVTTAPPPQPQGAPTQRRRDATGDYGGGAEEVVEGPHSPAGMSASLPHSPATPSTPWSVGNGAGAAPASAQGNPVAARSTTSLPSLMMNPYLPQTSGTARPQDPLASCRIPHSVIPVVVTDFGLAIVQEAHRRAGRGGGTKPYIAPECWRGQTCTASDIWSLGCVLYALATARLTARTVRIMSNEAKRDGFASMVLNDILEHNYSLAFASFVVSLLVVDPAKRPTAAMAEQCFVVNEETGTVAFDPTCPFFSNVLDL